MADRTVDQNVAKPSPRTAGSAAGRSYADATGERIEDTLDINNWDPAHRMAEQFERLQGEIIAAQVREMEARREIREQAFPLIARRDGAPRDAGVHEVELGELRTVQQHLLFSGHVQAVDGASVVHQTLPMTIFQTAIALATYLGDHGTWGHRVFQKDVRVSGRTALDRTLALLAQRKAAEDADDAGVSDMLRRGLMANAELAVMARKAEAPWRMGHGHPLPKELLTGAGMPELIELSIPLFRELLLDHKRFVYVPRGSNNHLLQTIGDALLPLEYAIVDDLDTYMDGVITQGHYGTVLFQNAKRMLESFQADASGKLVAGVFRVSPHSSSQVFYAHADHASEAAIVAMADAILVEARGFPMLLDLAGGICREMFPSDAIFKPAAAVMSQYRA
ncbi:hypothetical protein [Sphingomonas sanxanigenens]|uniref:hypothetical protein n=1 Tax=Sphingomonas sanxanigenens TaxID=397260 RepID=UPI001300F8E7|nr:hypothetical protein [Sphingomonas sanxanigenens]